MIAATVDRITSHRRGFLPRRNASYALLVQRLADPEHNLRRKNGHIMGIFCMADDLPKDFAAGFSPDGKGTVKADIPAAERQGRHGITRNGYLAERENSWHTRRVLK